MPTSLPRHQITETPQIARAIDLASARWPGESRARLLRRLVEAGGASLQIAEDEDTARRRDAVNSSSGTYADVFSSDHLAELRQDWPA
ncbi:hypothetical protein [Aeromicrobium sp. UC242_57]|uniref:hypothetical protein n=1 Tax=Aeromicrobium sp. UC242_57 TaxID=3374624 RepID=UPI003788A072